MRSCRISFGLYFLALMAAAQPNPCEGLNSRYQGLRRPAVAVESLIRNRDALWGSGSRETAQRELRDHGWSVFDDLTRKIGNGCNEPIWQTWYHIGPTTNKAQGVKRVQPFSIAVDIGLKMRERRPLPERPIESILFNSTGIQHVQSIGEAAGDQLSTWFRQGRREVAEFSRNSVVIKAFWHVLPKDGILRVGLWSPQDGKPGPRLPESYWTGCAIVYDAAIQPSGPSDCWGRSPVFVSRNQFYNIRVTPELRESLCEGQPSCSLNLDDWLILVGLHLSTKEAPDWFWGTFWWRLRNADVADAAFAPYRNPSSTTSSTVWSNYLGDFVISSKPIALGENRMTYNPYSEGAWVENGKESNCIVCHQPASTSLGNNVITGDHVLPRSVPRPPNNFAELKEAYSQLDNDYRKLLMDNSFEGTIRTDFIWSLVKFLNPTP